MHVQIHRPTAAAAAILGLALGLAACAGPGPTAAPSAGSPAISPAPSLTEVPGGTTPSPTADPTGFTTTETAWGTITDAIPATFPRFPGATPAEVRDGPVSGALLAPADAPAVASWYADALAAAAWARVDLGGPFEDGGYVLDVAGDLPECRLQASFRPESGSTIITVLYGAGCVTGVGGG